MKMHFEEKHKVLLTKHEHLWKLSNFERTEMKKIWIKRGRVTAKRTKKANLPLLVVLEKHCAQIPSMYFYLFPVLRINCLYILFLRDDLNLNNEDESKTSTEDEADTDNENIF